MTDPKKQPIAELVQQLRQQADDLNRYADMNEVRALQRFIGDLEVAIEAQCKEWDKVASGHDSGSVNVGPRSQGIAAGIDACARDLKGKS